MTVLVLLCKFSFSGWEGELLSGFFIPYFLLGLFGLFFWGCSLFFTAFHFLSLGFQTPLLGLSVCSMIVFIAFSFFFFSSTGLWMSVFPDGGSSIFSFVHILWFQDFFFF